MPHPVDATENFDFAAPVSSQLCSRSFAERLYLWTLLSSWTLRKKLDERLHELPFVRRAEIDLQACFHEVSVRDVCIHLDQATSELPSDTALRSNAHRLRETYEHALIADVLSYTRNRPRRNAKVERTFQAQPRTTIRKFLNASQKTGSFPQRSTIVMILSDLCTSFALSEGPF